MRSVAPRPVVHVQLEQPLKPLSARRDGQGVYAVFWLGDLPLGHEFFGPEELPLSRGDLAAIASDCVAPAVACRLFGASREYTSVTCTGPLAELRARRNDSRADAETDVSVIVVRDADGRGLARCLESIQRSTVRPRDVVVIDRNSEIEPVSARLVAFTDERSTVHPNWLRAVTAPFHAPDVVAVTGLVLPAELETEAQVGFERAIGGLNLGYQPAFFDRSNPPPPWVRAYLANLAVRADVLGRPDRSATVAAGAAVGPVEPRRIWQRVLATGMVLQYEPTAAVSRVPPRTVGEIEREASRQMAALDRSATASVARALLERAVRDIPFGSGSDRRMLTAQLRGCVVGAGRAVAARLGVRDAEAPGCLWGRA